jgi:WD40 repeat protein/tetratricopeptide (TPR) repeat protein
MPGTILGTPQYMSPEQARGEIEQLDERSDIYALGAILYSIVTLRAPVEGADASEVIAKVARGQIAPLECGDLSPLSMGAERGAGADVARAASGAPRQTKAAINRRTPHSLAAVAIKAMAVRPEDRYASVVDLQTDVTAYQNGFATSAERAGFFKQVGLAIRRHRRVAAVLAAALLLLLAVSALFTTRLVRERNRAEAGEALATTEREKSEDTLTRVQLQRAEELFAAGDDSGGLAYLAHVLRRQPEDRATAERLLSALRDQSHLRPVLDLPRQEGAINSLDWSPDGKLLLTHGKNLVRIWDGTSGELRVGPVQIPEANRAVRFSPDGRRFVAIGTDSQVFDTLRGKAITPLLVHEGRYDGQTVGQRNAVFAPDGKTILTTTRHEFANLWEVETGRKIRGETFVHRDIPLRRDLGGTTMPISSVFSPDGGFHVIGRADGQLVLWETVTWQYLQVLGDLQTFTASPAFSPDSKRLYFTQRDAITGIEVPSLKPLSWKIEPASPLVAYAVHPRGLELAVATADRQVRFYDAQSGRERSGSLGHTRDVVGLEYSADGARLVTRTDPSGLELWDTFSHRPLAARCPIRGDVMDFSLDRAGQRLAVATSDGSVRVWQIAPSEALPVILPVRADAERPVPESVILHPDGKHLATLSRQTAQVWDWTTGERIGPLLNHEQWICSAAFTPRGDRLLTGGSEDKQVRVWDYRTGREVGARMNSLSYLWNIGFPSAGERLCVSGSAVWDLATGRQTTPDFGEFIQTTLMSPDGRRVALLLGPQGTQKRIGRIYDSETGQQVGGEAMHTGSAVAIVLSPDSRAFATGADDGTARVWSLEDGAPLSPWLPHLAAITQVEFSPDSRRLLTVSADRTATVWEWASGARVGVPIQESATIHRAAFSPDGVRIATVAADHSLRLWEAATGRPLSAGLTMPARCAHPFSRLLWTPDGRHLIVGGGASVLVQVWDLPPVAGAAPPWMPDWAEAVGGKRLGSRGELEVLPEAVERETRQRLAQIEGDDVFARTGRWFFQAPEARQISPDGTLRRKQAISRLCAAASLPAAVETLRTVTDKAQRSPAASLPAAREALRLAPDDAEPWGALCWQRLQLATALSESEENELIGHLQWAGRLSAHEPLAWATRGAIHERRSRHDEAVAAWRRAAAYAPEDATLQHRLGLALAQQGDHAGAVEAFGESIRLAGLSVFDDVELAALHGARAAALAALGRHEEALPDRAVATRFPRRPPEATPRQIDLTLYYNRPLQVRIGMKFIQGLQELAPGLHTLAGVTFDARGRVDLHNRRWKLDLPQQVAGIRIGQECSALHFLHAAHYAENEPARALAEYVIHYADGTTEIAPAIHGRDIAQHEHDDAWNPPSPLTKAWTGKRDWHSGKRQPRSASLYKMIWRNPHPGKRVESLDFRLVPPSASPFLVAITAEE